MPVRGMKFYAITETELNQVTYLNTQVTYFASALSFCLTTFVGISITAASSEECRKNVFLWIIFGVFVLLSILFLCLMLHARSNRDSDIAVIKKESRARE
jgi:uncharacterized membrane protein YhaH (DUF805 family)